jgi:hypothetical protein
MPAAPRASGRYIRYISLVHTFSEQPQNAGVPLCSCVPTLTTYPDDCCRRPYVAGYSYQITFLLPGLCKSEE